MVQTPRGEIPEEFAILLDQLVKRFTEKWNQAMDRAMERLDQRLAEMELRLEQKLDLKRGERKPRWQRPCQRRPRSSRSNRYTT
jgi:hypothetical protein